MGRSNVSDDEEVVDYLGRVSLPPATPEQLEAAAEDVLGPEANEAPIGEGKVFRGTGGFFLQGPEENAGETLTAASREMQEALMAEARKVREGQADAERAPYLDPARNPMIKTE